MENRSVIDTFMGETRWLSNFEECPVMYESCIYPSSEHAFQAAKTLDHDARVSILRAPTPGKAKKIGQTVPLREGWTPQFRIVTMYAILKDKFTRNPHLKEKLLATGDQELVEGNVWGDKFWGVCEGEGENHLGKLLMQLRTTLREEAV